MNTQESVNRLLADPELRDALTRYLIASRKEHWAEGESEAEAWENLESVIIDWMATENMNEGL